MLYNHSVEVAEYLLAGVGAWEARGWGGGAMDLCCPGGL